MFLQDLVGINNVGGIANINAGIVSSGGDEKEFLKRLSSEIKYSANNLSVDGYGLNDLVRKMFAKKNYAQELKNPERILSNQDAKTIFTQSSGFFLINGEKGGKLNINMKALAINAILSGSISLPKNSADLLLNVVFLTGNRVNQTPISIVTNLSGDLKNLQQGSNTNQVRQYLGLELLNLPKAKEEILSSESQSETKEDAKINFLPDLNSEPKANIPKIIEDTKP